LAGTGGTAIVRNLVVMVCLVTVTVSGCASRSTEFVPPDVNREELIATIIRQGQEPAHETPPPPRPDTLMEKAAGYTLAGVGVVGFCVVAAPLFVLYTIAKCKEEAALGRQ